MNRFMRVVIYSIVLISLFWLQDFHYIANHSVFTSENIPTILEVENDIFINDFSIDTHSNDDSFLRKRNGSKISIFQFLYIKYKSYINSDQIGFVSKDFSLVSYLNLQTRFDRAGPFISSNF